MLLPQQCCNAAAAAAAAGGGGVGPPPPTHPPRPSARVSAASWLGRHEHRIRGGGEKAKCTCS